MKKSTVFIPKNYTSKLSLKETEIAIKKVKDFFEENLSKTLNLTRVSAPLFLDATSGVNDNLNGIERPVSFDMTAIDGSNLEIVQSLAKWKRLALHRYRFNIGEGIYTDMNAIRRDEKLDNLHSIYVDQWDWEKVISKDARNIATLKDTVKKIYSIFKATENYTNSLYPYLKKSLPDEISFITTQELEDMYPNLSEKEREDAICRQRKAVFLMSIGDTLKSGKKHDDRSPDYDDWSLNGDILFYYPLLDKAFELSSMGIRVDKKTLESQLIKAHCEERKTLPFHQLLLNEKLPQTIGGGIGQSRICMFFLQKAHIGEVQTSVWDENTIKTCKENNIEIL
ncbi:MULTISPECIES: aspartate--ammonia ligase [unclassified Clostridium]|jgi:aspartate--ammonia ligase|uniref:aspartate--ammonia ligase n=1 Tax=unclassified Clostridium TaxID=2614128 RepID=UPI000335FC48|nr:MULTISPECIES: aspartate--ammonia ligase [unclassified Clostridium]MEE0566465.1 aspartate--ammonia ligase [Clostridium sp.]CDB74523.1 aspartate--ammonia ligase [Clostridium sp. CAG:265]